MLRHSDDNDRSARTNRARQLRRNSTEAEKALWQHLRNRKVSDWKWRRQEPIGSYYADFACREARLVIELDGPQHEEADIMEYDEERTAFMEARGWKVLRFGNQEALAETERVLEVIQSMLDGIHRP